MGRVPWNFFCVIALNWFLMVVSDNVEYGTMYDNNEFFRLCSMLNVRVHFLFRYTYCCCSDSYFIRWSGCYALCHCSEWYSLGLEWLFFFWGNVGENKSITLELDNCQNNAIMKEYFNSLANKFMASKLYSRSFFVPLSLSLSFLRKLTSQIASALHSAIFI